MMTSLPKVFVLNMSILGICIARNLARCAIPVVGICAPSDVGRYSRYCEKLIYKKSDESPEEELIEFLVREGRKLECPGVLFPTDDDGAILISKYRERLNPYFKFSMPEASIMDTVVYKDNLQKAAERFNIPTAKSYFPKSLGEIEKIAREVEYPCILKPSYSRSWRRANMIDVVRFEKALKVRTADELVSSYRRIENSNCTILAQEYIEGGENYGVGSYVSRGFEPLAVVTAKKIRQAPLEFGTGTFLESVHEPRATELGLRFLKNIGYSGLSEIEFMRDPKTGEFKMIDFNARHWGWHSLPSRYGVNLSLIAYRDIIGHEPARFIPQEDGVKWWYVEKDAYFAMVCAMKGTLKLGDWLRTLRGKREYADFSWDDPVPFLVSGVKFLYERASSVAKKRLAQS
ncbi:MAG: carboxylate--amine ligase [Deltaproteobacteria bacterium]